jgi:tetratricopeptide (TPR) repeat protein
MNQPPNEPSRPSVPEDSSDGFPVLEGYDVIDQLGRGGMGVVYEAFQRSTGRRVAVKLMLERVAATEAARRRFEREVELIARLQHPNIVGILDSGLHKGRYFYVMDFVEGSGVDQRFKPGITEMREALRVVAKVARAVDYAHQRGVMHRDLKPANILIDQRGEPHLLDFGLAKAFDPNSLVAMRDSLSEPGQVIGTLGYMAPEQARGSMGEVSVRSDVYALGAIAYEMVAGALPCPIDGPMAIVFQRIESRDPDRPSTVRPGGGVPADIDAVLMKALEKDPAKRYPTAGAFADDLERWLGNLPVAARHVGPIERGARWCRRNPAWAGLAVAVGLALAILAGSAWWTSRAGRQREQAEKIKSDIDATLGDAMMQLDPDENPGLFEAAALTIDRIEAGLAKSPRPPLEEAVWRERIAEQQRKIGEFDKAERNARRVVELRRGLTSGDDADLARALRNLGAALFDLSRFTDAQEPYRAALEMRQRLAKGRDDEAVADSLNHLAQCLTRLGGLEEAEPLQRAAFEMRRRLFGEGDERTVAAQNNVATILLSKGDFARSEAMYREAMQRFIALRGDKHRYVGRSLRNIAACVAAQGRLDEADELLAKAQAVTTEVLGPSTPEIAGVLHDIAALRLAQGRSEEAEPMARQALSIRLSKLGPANQDSVDSKLLLGRILLASGRVTEAEPMLRETVERRLQANPPVPADVSEARLALGVTLVALGRADEGMPLIRDGTRSLSELRPAGDPRSGKFFAALEGDLARLPENDDIREARAVLVPGAGR